MKRAIFSILYVLVIAANASAQNVSDELSLDDAPALQPVVESPVVISYAIKQIIRSKNIVIVESSVESPFRSGKIFLATFPDGHQCTLELQEVNRKLMAFDASDCNQGTPLTLTTPVEPSLLVESPSMMKPVAPAAGTKASTSTKAKGRSPFSATLYYSVADKVIFKNAQATTGSGTGTIEASYDSKGSFGFGANYLNPAEYSWGLTGSLLYEPRRKVSSLTMKGPSGNYNNAFSTQPEFSIFIVEAGIAYKWSKAYLPLSLNYSVPALTYASNTEVWDITGTVGGNLGFGYLFSENSACEVFLRAIGLKGRATDASTAVDFGSGYLTGFGVGYKYYF
ncbi:hypothetical protein [Bdellovibrio sp. NC01]|uniref:hypothetical protein n=1 Tax=Bdellovibrio sp. NC01 TaxID=2220073 RepID=UPI001159F803|nr:hypothetical protein [Bdellovibrio sp. NC01]QDK38434.1 hypothetical protein DOE51_13035 [Bdellovibrio sp. NC01]